MKHLIVVLVLLSQTVLGQGDQLSSETLIGNWEGAFIKNNSYQKIAIEFSENENQLYALQIMDEWHPTFGEFEVPVTIDSTGKIKFGTGYGNAELILDKENLELVGQLQGFNPAVYVHLKKVAQPPQPNYTVEEVSIQSGKNQIFGHLHIPTQIKHQTAVIIVGGRGCYADDTKYNLYAKFLREYGVSVLAYQKQGTGKSTGDCSKSTINDLANDLIQVKQFLALHSNQYTKIGVIGISAGGWTMVKAEESAKFDFMISVVGPATSVKDQQFQSMQYGAEIYKLDETALQHLTEYTELMFSAKANEKGFSAMNNLLAASEKENWNELLDDTDIPSSAAQINELWVRRHSYDPKETLLNYKQPFIGIYGERDWIVPFEENITLLDQYFADRKQLLKTKVAHNADHGMEMQAKQIDLGSNQSYWHFYRVSPEVRIEIVDFLRNNELIE